MVLENRNANRKFDYFKEHGQPWSDHQRVNKANQGVLLDLNNGRNDDLANRTLTMLTDNLENELRVKSHLRSYLISWLSIFFIVITCIIFGIILFRSDSIQADIQKCLIIGLFGNLFALLLVVYRYAFSDTEKLMKSIHGLLH